VVSGSVQEMSIHYSRRILDWKTELLRHAAIQCVLNQLMVERANVVNSATIAQERGIQVRESRKEKSATAGSGDVISLGIKTTSDEHLVKGTVLRGTSLRLLGVDDIDVEAPLEGKLIYLRNRDVPGVVGKVGTILGQQSINIANFALGRSAKPDATEAIAVVQVDNAAPEAVLQLLRELPEIQEVRSIQF